MPRIAIGRAAPAFSLLDQDGKTRTLKHFAGRALVLFFYPADASDKCTEEVCEFRDRIQHFRKVKTAVVGVSPDDAESHRRFDTEHGLDFPLLADPAHHALDAYGVWTDKIVFGRRAQGVSRTTYLIGPDGRVARRWDNVSVRGHADDVLAVARALHSGERLVSLGEVKPIRKRVPKRTTRVRGSGPPYAPIRGPTGAGRIRPPRQPRTGGRRARSRR